METPDREKKGKRNGAFGRSRPPRLSAGQPSGVREDPPLQDRQVAIPGSDLDGRAPGGSRDPESNGEPEPLSESDVIRISRCVLRLLMGPPPDPPSKEEGEEKVGPQLASRVLASFGSLAKQLSADLYCAEREGGLWLATRNGMSAEHRDGSSSSGSSSSPPPQPPRPASGHSFVGGGPRSAQRQGDAGQRVGMTRTWWGQPYYGPLAQPAAYVTANMIWDPLRAAELEVSWCRQTIMGLQEALARVRAAHAMEVQQLVFELEGLRMRMHHRQASPPPSEKPFPAPKTFGVGAKQKTPHGEVVAGAARSRVINQVPWRWQVPRPPLSLAALPPLPEDVHDLALQPRNSGLNVSADQRRNGARDRRWLTAGSGAVADTRTTGPGRQDPLDGGEKNEGKMARVVAMVKEHLPTLSEAEVRRHVVDVCRLQRGFAGLSLASFVALVLRHIRNASMHGGH